MAAIFIAAIFIYLTHTVVVITISKPSGGQNDALTLTQLNKNGTRTPIFSIGPIAYIPRDTQRIEGATSRWQTTADVTPLPWFGLKEIKLSIERDHNVDKVSGGSLGCTVYEASTDTYASYACYNPAGLYTFQTSETDGVPWKNQPYFIFPQAYSVTDYESGLIGIQNSITPSMFYADITKKSVTFLTPPPEIGPSELGGTSIVTDATTPSDHFLLVNPSKGVIYFASKEDGAITYQKYAPDKDWLKDGSTTCALRQTTAYCYIGASTMSFDTHGEASEQELHKHNDGHLVVIKFGSETISYTTSIVPNDEPIDELYVDGSGQLFATASSNLYNLDISKLHIHRTIVTPLVSTVASGKTLYYVSNNRLYEFNSRTKMTSLRFYSKNLRLSTINQTSSNIFINAFIESARGNTLQTYQLLSEENVTPDKRLVDVLPVYPKANQSEIIDVDYYKNLIHVVLPNYVKYNQNKKIVADDQRFLVEKQEATNYLGDILPSLNNYKLTFSRAENP
jgi:hypothetical protein